MVDDKKSKKRKIDFNNSVVSKKMLVIAFASPFVLSIASIIITFYATINYSDTVRKISLIIATFLGLGLSILVIFAMQRIINKKLNKMEDKNSHL